MSAEGLFCATCYAEAGQGCAWDCIGLAVEVDRLGAQLSHTESAPSVAATPDAIDAHCLACH